MFVFDGRKVVSKLRKEFVMKAWVSIRNKFEGLTVDRASFLTDEVQVVLKDMSGIGVDISPLQHLLEYFFKPSPSYDQERSTFIDEAAEIEKSDSYLKAKEHLKLVMKERADKSGELSTSYQSLEKARKKVKKLKALRDAAKEIESKVSAAEEEFSKCADIFLAIENASNDIEKKKQELEASL
ncbi:hypothetical protein T459_19525 [Capsicum annuum]|uniref:Uncharacterized protein n=1 Tax=Capsicum annuum TaxID=4072 RepID=A0A2G2Z201_CAPAN|nr:hypothetical protein T459_19525 [Capsicum annuum]